ncbi:hypothetical protein MS3_00004800 [Schistosoma haematobium]|uniref:Uncharacterized protein n=1 Tax=Schistosoma haematobium TaxID=6185 RepID=A0A922LIV7_SCHHA|nr:hypothetical protein MS3_00004800 [Schistosoma haematobium]KAH9586844.1 hypothetical protein MS3_00004800 [Schistosoma haematobium]
MEWIQIMILLQFLLLLPSGYYNHFNNPLLIPKISLKSIKIPLNDYFIKYSKSSLISSLLSPSSLSPSSSSSSSSLKGHPSNNVCLLLHLPNIKSINQSQINLTKIYIKSNHILDLNNNNNIWAIFQLDHSQSYSSLFVTLKYLNQSFDHYSIQYPLYQWKDYIYIFMLKIINNGDDGDNNIDYQLFSELSSSMYPSCLLDNNHFNDLSKLCISLIHCNDHFIENIQEINSVRDVVLRRVRRDISSSSSSTSSLNVSNSSTTMNEEIKPALSPGLLAVIIIIPILIIIGLIIGGYYLYRWLKKRRASHGIYQPNYMENESNIIKQQPEPHTIVKIPNEERLI